MLVAGICSPAVGRAIDRHGGRPALALSSVLMAIGLCLMGFASNLAIYYLAWTCIGVAMAAGLYDAAVATLGRLFGESARASMSGLSLLGGFTSTLGWPLIAALEHELGWRYTCFVLASAHLAIGLPIHLLLIPRVTETAVATARINEVDSHAAACVVGLARGVQDLIGRCLQIASLATEVPMC
ncbi:MFS transporter [Pseudomonas aeruginosa]